MGSDMHMASESFRARPKRFRWEDDEFVIQVDTLMDGYVDYWRGKVDATSTASLIMRLVSIKELPAKPKAPKGVTRISVEAPAHVARLSQNAAWSEGWNDAVDFFGIKVEEAPEQEWMTWQTI